VMEYRANVEKDPKQKVPPAIWKKYHEAVEADCWIYHANTHHWYTPAEFLENWQNLYRESRYGADNLADFKIMDAMAGERAYKKQMRDAMAAYLKFRNKMEDYFSFRLKKK